jgi:DNA-binding PadR family transcriptional regulator
MTRERVSTTQRPNDPPILILTSLAGGPKHGHALSKDIEDFAGIILGPGALYGAITRLEERGLIEPLESNDRRRPYRISATGSVYLSQAVAQMQRLAGEGARRLAVANKPSTPRRGPRVAGSPA